MGYQAGRGLGKNLEGRSKIVEAFVRKGRGAVGAYGSEGGGPKAQKKAVDSEDEEEKKFKEKLSQWRTGGQVGGKKKKVVLIEEAQSKVKYFQPTRDDQNTWIPVFVTQNPEDQLGQKEFKYFLENQGEIGFNDFPVPFDEIVTRRGRELIRKAFRGDDYV